MKTSLLKLACNAGVDMHPLMRHEISVAQSCCGIDPEFAERFIPAFTQWVAREKDVLTIKEAEEQLGVRAFVRFKAEAKASDSYHLWRRMLWMFEEKALSGLTKKGTA